MLKRAPYAILALVFLSSAMAADDKVEDLSRYFTGFDGCFVLYDEPKNETAVYNEAKCGTRVSPCSSFKIIHSLIGLETGVLRDEHTVFTWDGVKSPIPEWNRDQTLESAVKNSVVWYFQKVARSVGREKEQYFVDKVGYGNRDLSGELTGFWLQSSLKISPREQIDVLRRFYHYQLPFSRRNVDIVKKIIVQSRENGVTFSGKTGSGVVDGRAVNGWFVGYVEKGGGVHYFALNIEGAGGATGMKAKEIAQRILADKELL
jgi:beta-lactamase class D